VRHVGGTTGKAFPNESYNHKGQKPRRR
jgi:hypothetical protein